MNKTQEQLVKELRDSINELTLLVANNNKRSTKQLMQEVADNEDGTFNYHYLIKLIKLGLDEIKSQEDKHSFEKAILSDQISNLKSRIKFTIIPQPTQMTQYPGTITPTPTPTPTPYITTLQYQTNAVANATISTKA